MLRPNEEMLYGYNMQVGWRNLGFSHRILCSPLDIDMLSYWLVKIDLRSVSVELLFRSTTTIEHAIYGELATRDPHSTCLATYIPYFQLLMRQP